MLQVQKSVESSESTMLCKLFGDDAGGDELVWCWFRRFKTCINALKVDVKYALTTILMNSWLKTAKNMFRNRIDTQPFKNDPTQ